jgi:hypothetical protein
LYNRKRRAYLSGQAHFVEIDLLRGGRRFRMVDDWPDAFQAMALESRHSRPDNRRRNREDPARL